MSMPLDDVTAATNRLDRFRELRASLSTDLTLLAGQGFTISELARRSGYTENGVRKVLGRPSPVPAPVEVHTDRSTLAAVLAEVFPGEDLEVYTVASVHIGVRKPFLGGSKTSAVDLAPERAEQLRTALRAKGLAERTPAGGGRR